MKHGVSPTLKIYLDTDGDYLVSFEGKAAVYLTMAGLPWTAACEWTDIDPSYEHLVWQSGDGS